MSPNPLKSLIGWCLYAWASDVFPILITTFIFSTYFIEHIAPTKVIGTYLWANATTLAGIVIAISGPILGSLADQRGQHKRWLGFLTSITLVSTALLWFALPNINDVNYALLFFIIGTIAFELALIFYNSYLPFLAPREKLGRLSGWSWGLGYLGGIIALTIMLIIGVIAKPTWLNAETFQHIRIVGPFAALWFGCFSLPLFLWVKDTPKTALSIKQSLQASAKELQQTFKMLWHEKNTLRFLIARMIYNDGLNTLFAFGGIFAAGTFHFSFMDIILFGITLNILAGFGAISFAWLDDAIGSKKTIVISLYGLILFGSILLLCQSAIHFWICASLLSIFIGPVQSASRSLMAHLAPRDKTSELFGLYALTGRVTAFLGPWLLGMATLYFNSQRAGMATIILFFTVGLWLVLSVKQPTSKAIF